MELRITSVQNPRVKQVVRLRERRERQKSDRFLIEGYRELLRAVESGWEIETLYISPSHFLGKNEQSLIDRLASDKVPIIQCSEKVFQKLSYRDRPDGLLAIAPQRHPTLDDVIVPDDVPSLFVIAESIEKPGNLGTILRSSDASGVHAVVVCDRCTDVHNPNVVRASVGMLFTVPVVEAKGEHTLQWLKKRRVSILAATPEAELEYTAVDMTGPLAIAVGTEQLGLSSLWMDSADMHVRIPMFGVADSLNVATATTLLLYEAVRQRRSLL
ncbi:MAG: RNA methyltransferase [Waddliaceae bacterium]